MKITKLVKYAAIMDVLRGEEIDPDIDLTVDDLVEFCQQQIDVVTKQSEARAAKRAAEEPEEDPYIDTIAKCLTTSFEPLEAITARITDEELTRGKVVSRLAKMCGAGAVEKTVENYIGEDGKAHSLTKYRLAH